MLGRSPCRGFIEIADAFANISDIVVAERGVHRQHNEFFEHLLGVRESLRKAELVELVYGLATPLDQRAHSSLFQIFAEFVTVGSLQLVILIDVEVSRVGVWRWRQA